MIPGYFLVVSVSLRPFPVCRISLMYNTTSEWKPQTRRPRRAAGRGWVCWERSAPRSDVTGHCASCRPELGSRDSVCSPGPAGSTLIHNKVHVNTHRLVLHGLKLLQHQRRRKWRFSGELLESFTTTDKFPSERFTVWMLKHRVRPESLALDKVQNLFEQEKTEKVGETSEGNFFIWDLKPEDWTVN